MRGEYQSLGSVFSQISYRTVIGIALSIMRSFVVDEAGSFFLFFFLRGLAADSPESPRSECRFDGASVLTEEVHPCNMLDLQSGGRSKHATLNWMYEVRQAKRIDKKDVVVHQIVSNAPR